ncbi:MAG: hypothetical protein D6781_12420 [Verrucomicrobia bacterium]|nr:MAG: hypothetical protein D6781_12420 [Verrucomicrobiota bacterium]
MPGREADGSISGPRYQCAKTRWGSTGTTCSWVGRGFCGRDSGEDCPGGGALSACFRRDREGLLLDRLDFMDVDALAGRDDR